MRILLLFWWFLWVTPAGWYAAVPPVVVGPFLNVMDCNKTAVSLPRQKGDWVSECWADGRTK